VFLKTRYLWGKWEFWSKNNILWTCKSFRKHPSLLEKTYNVNRSSVNRWRFRRMDISHPIGDWLFDTKITKCHGVVFSCPCQKLPPSPPRRCRLPPDALPESIPQRLSGPACLDSVIRFAWLHGLELSPCHPFLFNHLCHEPDEEMDPKRWRKSHRWTSSKEERDTKRWNKPLKIHCSIDEVNSQKYQFDWKFHFFGKRWSFQEDPDF
jgi:hypothetical protein